MNVVALSVIKEDGLDIRGWALRSRRMVVERLTKISVIIMQSIPLGDTVNVILRYAF